MPDEKLTRQDRRQIQAFGVAGWLAWKDRQRRQREVIARSTARHLDLACLYYLHGDDAVRGYRVAVAAYRAKLPCGPVARLALWDWPVEPPPFRHFTPHKLHYDWRRSP